MKKGAWAGQLRAGQQVAGFFAVRGKDRPCLADASGAIPLAGTPGSFLANGVIAWISGTTTLQEHSTAVQAASIVPVSSWTGNPFAFPPEDAPNAATVWQLCRHFEDIEACDPETASLGQRVLSRPNLLRAFLKAPASLRHHHAFAGGLAMHTCEVLDVIARFRHSLEPEDYCLVMMAGLLHDIGKAFEYHGNRLSPRGRLLGHEVTLLELIVPAADATWPHGHPKRLKLFHLLTAKPAPKWTGIRHPRTPLSALLRFADRWSVESDLHKRRKKAIPVVTSDFSNQRYKAL